MYSAKFLSKLNEDLVQITNYQTLPGESSYMCISIEETSTLYKATPFLSASVVYVSSVYCPGFTVTYNLKHTEQLLSSCLGYKSQMEEKKIMKHFSFVCAPSIGQELFHTVSHWFSPNVVSNICSETCEGNCSFVLYA